MLGHVGTVDRSMIGGHCEITFTDVFVPDVDILGEVDRVFDYAQMHPDMWWHRRFQRTTGCSDRPTSPVVPNLRRSL